MNQYLNKIQELCLENKYTRCYIDIILNALNRTIIEGYSEKHHILPKCFKSGGEKDTDNIVKLTGKEHFICHQLLVKMVEDKTLKFKLACAALKMAYSNNKETADRYKITSTQYSHIKKQLSENKKGIAGKKWTIEQKEKLKNRIPHNKGIPMSEEAKENLREKRKYQIITNETKEKVSKKLSGRPWSESRRNAENLKRLSNS